ncbi:metalloregulator ArsR/SmtB family transcription factor [Aminobacter sp. BA135]|uniref:ArsR/SmtB family transcription factor n=1 Tax=Aminobacter sp. BA135 TaxID=537596 RepID=UPI003D7A2E5C
MSELLERAGEASEFLKKLANPNRLMIVCALVDGERSVRDLEDRLGIRQPGLSQQLAELRDAGLIAGRKESKSVFYRLADERVAEMVALLYRMFCGPATAPISNEKQEQ